MTTAHRATWKAARGGLQEEGSFRLHVPSAAVSAKDAPTERDLKKRDLGAQSRKQLRDRLEEDNDAPDAKRLRIEPASTAEGDVLEEEGVEEIVDGTSHHPREPHAAKEPHEPGGASESDEESESDDEAELLAELEAIKREREFTRAKKHAAEAEAREREETARASTGNPLLAQALFHDEISDTASIATGATASVAGFGVRRRWNDDSIFQGQARTTAPRAQRWVNDTTRNAFHRRFMRRYMR